MMIGKENVQMDVEEMIVYFGRCAENAAPGSEARERFTRWAANLGVVLSEMLLRDMTEEDDGK